MKNYDTKPQQKKEPHRTCETRVMRLVSIDEHTYLIIISNNNQKTYKDFFFYRVKQIMVFVFSLYTL